MTATDNFSAILANRSSENRHSLDFYPTPPSATIALIKHLRLGPENMVWECASGEGDMAKVFQHFQIDCIGTDIKDGHDFLKIQGLSGGRFPNWIITNPPFNLAAEFIRHAYSLNINFALLLKSQYWHASNRSKLFQECQPTEILPLSWRIDYKYKERGLGNEKQGSPTMDHIWCVWERDLQGKLTPTTYQPLPKPIKNDFEFWKSMQ